MSVEDVQEPNNPLHFRSSCLAEYRYWKFNWNTLSFPMPFENVMDLMFL